MPPKAPAVLLAAQSAENDPQRSLRRHRDGALTAPRRDPAQRSPGSSSNRSSGRGRTPRRGRGGQARWWGHMARPAQRDTEGPRCMTITTTLSHLERDESDARSLLCDKAPDPPTQPDCHPRRSNRPSPCSCVMAHSPQWQATPNASVNETCLGIRLYNDAGEERMRREARHPYALAGLWGLSPR